MNAYEQSFDLPELAHAWSAFQKHVKLEPIRTEADFERIQQLADTLALVVGTDRSHPLSSLYELAMGLIEQWEDVNVTLPPAPPREVLRYLLEEHDLKQEDLEDIASPTVISDILAGRREISRRLAKALAERFHVDIGAFI
jgi:HTH-type transcriptional regulator/antitoxin HigA